MLRATASAGTSIRDFFLNTRNLTALIALLLMVTFAWRASDRDIRAVRAANNFTPGNIVVYRVGDGTASITSAATATFLDEYTPAGTLVQSISLPTTANGANRRLTNSGTATSEGLMSASADGHYLIVAGYDAALGTPSITSSASTAINRVIGRIDANGNVDTTTALTDGISGGNPRSATSTNGTDFWIDGSVQGVRYATLGSTTSTLISNTITNLRATNVFAGQLYVDTASGTARLNTVGTGTPTTAGQTIATLPGFPTPASPYGFFFAQLDPTSAGVDTVYVADDSSASAGGGLQKYSLVNGAWSASGTVGVGTTSLSLRGVTGSVNNGVVTLYAVGSSTTAGNLYSFVDNTGQRGSIAGGSLTLVASSSANRVFRGVAFAPLGSGPTNPSGAGSANPSSVAQGASTKLTVSVTPGTNPASSGLAVTADLSSIGGSATQAFFDDGSNGDITPGDNIFTYQATVSPGNSLGPKSIAVTITDAQSRTGNATINLTVTASSTPPSGVGAASPASLMAGNPTLLTVTAASGTNPPSSNIAVTANLSAIGGSSSQQLFDDGTNGDATAGDGIFSFLANVSSGTGAGAKSLAFTVSDDQARSSNGAIALTIQPPPPPNTIKISQVYGGGGNSGATYTNDFIELFNDSASPVDISGWSVQYSSATISTWVVTPICPNGGCVIQPYHYFLIQESAGAAGTTVPPAADLVGTIAMGAGSGKVALVAGSDALSGCPALGSVVDLVGYGTANCSETANTPALGNTLAAIRKNNGCTDTDNNQNDFIVDGPVPRNSHSPINSCGSAGALSGQGLATPDSELPATDTTLTVAVTPATTPPSTGVTVVADLSAFNGNSTQQFYDDGTHGDKTAGDGIYSITVPAPLSTGLHATVAAITDTQGRTATAPLTMTVVSPTCGVERWTVKVGTDPDAGSVDLSSETRAAISDLGAIPPPANPPDNARVVPFEFHKYVINGTLMQYKLETDVDYHLVVDDGTGRTMIVEIPNPACVLDNSTPRNFINGPFNAAIAAARQKFDNKLTAQTFFQIANIPVQIKGVAFFDFEHGQTGIAPNGMELHPVLEINFPNQSTTTLLSNNNPSQFGQNVTLTASVTGGSSTATGNVTFTDGGTPIGIAPLDASGTATFTTNSLGAGSHQLRASYEGDSTASNSVSGPFTQSVSAVDQTVTFDPIPNKVTADAPFAVNAVASSGLPVTYSIVSGPATASGNIVTLTKSTGTVVVQASQAGNGSYNPASATQSFNVSVASPQLTAVAQVANTGSGYAVIVTVRNTGNVTANNVTLTNAQLGTSAGSPLPQAVGTLNPGGSATATVTVSATAGNPGQMVAGKFTVSSTVGTFSSAAKIVLPQAPAQ